MEESQAPVKTALELGLLQKDFFWTIIFLLVHNDVDELSMLRINNHRVF